jgi:hypothetical protein
MGRPSSGGTKIVDIQMSHGRPRTELRRPTDGGTPALPPVENTVLAEPIQDVKGRFVKGNTAARRKRLKTKAKGIHTINPAKCESWLQPHVAAGVQHGLDLLARFTDPILAPLAGIAADSLIVYRGLIALGAQGDHIALREARAWAKEYRGYVRELCALAALQLEQDQKEALAESFFDAAGVPTEADDVQAGNTLLQMSIAAQEHED